MLHNLKSSAAIAGNGPGKPDSANNKNNPTKKSRPQRGAHYSLISIYHEQNSNKSHAYVSEYAGNPGCKHHDVERNPRFADALSFPTPNSTANTNGHGQLWINNL